MIQELRVYSAVPGKLPAISKRFAKHTLGFFKDHGIGVMGFWVDEIGTSNQLTYILTFDSMADREEKWAAFQANTDWQRVRSESETDGTLVAVVHNTFLRPTPYSPATPSLKSKIQELRVYDTMPGKLPALHNRFADHTLGLFEKHGIENIAYWTEEVGISSRLVYMLGYASLGDREKSWDAFQSDPEWQSVRAESEKDGVLVRVNNSKILRPTRYSPR